MTSGRCNQPALDPIVDEAKNDCCVNFEKDSTETLEAYPDDDGDDESSEMCEEGHGCDFACYIRDGEALCHCSEGQKLAADKKTCVEDSVIGDNIQAANCEKGLLMSFDGYCEDIDECKEEKDNCGMVEICVNTIGSFYCEPFNFCPEGFSFDEDSKKCEGERLFVKLLVNFILKNLSDINECMTRYPCFFNETCENTKGSFKCFPKTCHSGYKLDLETGQCEDINECKNPKACDRLLECVNTPGSYSCECKYGLRKHPRNDLNCQDIDECVEHPGLCEHKCFNTNGSYQCSCERGYKLNSDNRTCSDIDECKRNGKHLCYGTCKNLIGSYKCDCPDGFKLQGSQFCAGKKPCLL